MQAIGPDRWRWCLAAVLGRDPIGGCGGVIRDGQVRDRARCGPAATGVNSLMRVIGLSGWSGAGKTTLLRRLIPALTARGRSVSTLKHAHHNFDVDQPGKDSWEHRQAGAQEVLVASGVRWALMHELRGAAEPGLRDLLRRLDPVDLVLVEGFKRACHPKIEIFRAANAKPPLHPDDASIVAVAADVVFDGLTIPLLHLDAIEAIADVVDSQARPVDGIDWDESML
jgi:molybdopterin-guanine dinucleotide biosynthesis protein B